MLLKRVQKIREHASSVNQCQSPKCVNPTSQKLAYSVRFKKVFCRECLWEIDSGEFEKIALDHLRRFWL